MPQDTRIALFLMGELVGALLANDPDAFKGWSFGGVQDLGESGARFLMTIRLPSFNLRLSRSKYAFEIDIPLSVYLDNGYMH